MKIWPVLFDATPGYLAAPRGGVGLLLAPNGRELLLQTLLREVQEVTADPPVIVLSEGSGDTYRARLAGVVPAGTVIVDTEAALAEALAGAETADLLLLVDPRCLPARAGFLGALFDVAARSPETAHHLVARAADLGGTREAVTVDNRGQVRGVHRYYRTRTWPFIAGVAASLVPASDRVLSSGVVPASLIELRERLVARGVPSHDVPLDGAVFDLSDEGGMLAAVEHAVRRDVGEQADGSTTLLVGGGHAIDPTARLLGPVVLLPGAQVQARATLVGPVVLGPRAVVGADAVAAHVCVGADARIPPGRVLRDRTWFQTAEIDFDAAVQAATDRRASFAAQLARHGVETADSHAGTVPGGGTRWGYPTVKRAVDVVASAAGLLLLSPLLLFIAALIRLDSRGSVLFRHTREGMGGRPFGCLKFRTMHDGASHLERHLKVHDRMDGPHMKLDADPRVTRIGRLLRATNLDELPQLVNVLTGDMSLVGPRPSPFRENQICVPWREGRLSVRPGITGLWQVCRHDRDAGDFHQWIEYDLLYVRHLSAALDLRVLVATILTLGGKHPVPVSRMIPSTAEPGPPSAPRRSVPGAVPRDTVHSVQPARSTR